MPNCEQMFYGPYWVLAYSESEGYAIVSGGNPTIPTENGLCKTGSGVNNSGTPFILSIGKLAHNGPLPCLHDSSTKKLANSSSLHTHCIHDLTPRFAL